MSIFELFSLSPFIPLSPFSAGFSTFFSHSGRKHLTRLSTDVVRILVRRSVGTLCAYISNHAQIIAKIGPIQDLDDDDDDDDDLLSLTTTEL